MEDPKHHREPRVYRSAAASFSSGIYNADIGMRGATVRATESLGHETILHAAAEVTTVAFDAQTPITAVTETPILSAVLRGYRPLQHGEPLRLSINSGNLHFFAPRRPRPSDAIFTHNAAIQSPHHHHRVVGKTGKLLGCHNVGNSPPDKPIFSGHPGRHNPGSRQRHRLPGSLGQ